jgi:3-methylcrotonyl-CoA carboxylase beta subunit
VACACQPSCLCLQSQVEADKHERGGTKWAPEDEAAFKKKITDRYDSEGSPFFASARLWDDGVIDPADTRRVVGMSLAAALNAQVSDTTYGVFRM